MVAALRGLRRLPVQKKSVANFSKENSFSHYIGLYTENLPLAVGLTILSRPSFVVFSSIASELHFNVRFAHFEPSKRIHI